MPSRLELAALLARPEDVGQIIHAARWEEQPVAGHLERAGIGDRRHLDCRLGAVEEGVEHLRVHARGPGRLRRQAVVRPDFVRRDRVIERQVLGPFPCGCHREPGRPRPVHHLGHERRLVAIGHRVDHAALAGLGRQERPDQRVGLDIDHDDVPTGLDRRQRVGDTGHGRARRLDHHLDPVAAQASSRSRRNGSGRSADRPSRRSGRLRAPGRHRGRRSPRPPAPEWSGPGTGTSSRTCRRRSGRLAPAARSRHGRRACASGSRAHVLRLAPLCRPRQNCSPNTIFR